MNCEAFIKCVCKWSIEFFLVLAGIILTFSLFKLHDCVVTNKFSNLKLKSSKKNCSFSSDYSTDNKNPGIDGTVKWSKIPGLRILGLESLVEI